MIALVDCNNFYCSCERLFNPQLRNKAVVVLSNNDSCVIARSEEAKAIGINMGDPAFLIDDLLKKHKVFVFSSNYVLYGDLSDRVHETLSTFTDQIELYSIDEAFMDLTNFKYQNLLQYGCKIKDAIAQNIGIPVSVGIAPTKTLAKIANRFAKKKKKEIGVHVLQSTEDIHNTLKCTQVGDIWGIGRQYTTLLIKKGIRTAYDFANAPEEFVRKNLTVQGQRLWNEIKGLPCIDLELNPPAKKMICVARGFGKPLTKKNEIEEALSTYTSHVAAKLRSEKQATSMLHIFLQTNAYKKDDAQYFRSINIQLPEPTNSTPQLIHFAIKALDMLYRPGYNFNKTGCIAMELVPEDSIQLGIFETIYKKQDRNLMKALDAINNSLGKDTVRFGTMGFQRSFKLKQAKLSPYYTTQIKDIPIIRNNISLGL